MVPFMYIPVSHIPRTANGKLDRKHLRAAISRLSHKEVDGYSLQDTAKQAPASEAERLLQSLWANILSRPSETIGANDDFFRLGGDSVSAIRLVAAARAQNTPLTVASIFRSPRLSDMALALEGTERNQGDDHSMVLQDTAFDLLDTAEIDLESVKADAAEQCRVDSQKIQDIYPCTTLQEGLMSLSTRLGGGSYLAQSVFRLGPNFDIAKFKSAWQTVAKLEPILRTRIVHMGTFGTLQVVLDEDLEWIEVEDGVDAYLSKDLQEPVSYGSPLLRLALVRSSEGYHFVWSAHHAVYDAWSVNITFGQVRQAFSGEQISTAVAYKEFIRHLEQNNSDEASRAFWDSQFSSTKPAPTTLPLVPAGYTQSSHQTERASPSTKISCTDGTTVSTILRAAWALTVARYTDSDDVVFAATLSGRTVPVDGISTINGPTMATVPVRVSIDLAGEMTAQQLLRAIQTQATDMMAFEQTGLQNIRRVNATASNAIDGMGNLLVLQPSSSSTEPPSFEGIELIPRDLAEFGGYPLVIICHINDNGSVTIEAKYDALLIPSQQMQRMIRHYAFVMDQLCQEPNARLCEIHNNTSPMDLAEIVRWNGPLPEALQMRVHDVVSDRAKEDPDAQAVSAWDGNFTYGELELITDKLASHLQSLGVGTEAKVGLCVEKSRWHVVAMLSVLKAGGAYTNINPLYPATATHQMLQDLEATTVLCSAQYVSLFPASTTEHVVVLDAEFFEQLPAPAVTPITSNVNPNNAAFVVFTSGSTGKPKGVTVEHSGFSSMQHYQTPKLEIGKATRMLQFAAHWFDISNFEAFAALMSGACVCIPSEEERLDDLAAAINKYAVNWATMVPTAAAVLEPEDVPGLKHLSLGGESIPPDLHARWSKRVMLMNSYGPAECSVLTTMGLLQPHTLSQNIGVGVACRTWITDKSNSDLLVPIGCVGELCVEGPILSRGYHKEEGLTCQAYIFNPDFVKSLSTKSTVRIYKTGDLVRYASDGTLVYVGRKDSQVKIHGRRIECGEVEHHIVSHGFSADSVVVEKILESDNAERPILAAFIRLQTSSVEEERESARSSSLLANKFGTDERGALVALRRALEDGLPPHMIPSVFITLRYMPVTHTGKKDRKALKQLGAQLTHGQLEKFRILGHDSDKSLQELGVVSSICSSYFELQLQVLWSKILGITQDSIGANDHFIQKGGDSVRAVRLSAAIRRELSRILSVGDIFSHPRLGEMAKCLDSQTDPKIAAAAESESIYASGSVAPFALVGDKYDESEILDHVAQECQVRTDDIEDIYPCTPLQAGMMAISTYEPDAYVAKRVFKIPDGINLEVFKQAWGRAAEAIPILRTRIVPNPKFDASLQVVLKNETPEWHEIRGSVKTYLTQQRDNWNIAYGQPLSAYGIAPRSRRFVWAIHHALYDGFTASRVIDIVQNFYYCMTLPQPTLPSFSRFIHHLEIVDSARSARFWRENLGGSGSPSSYPRLPSAAYQPQPDSEYVFSFDMTHHASAGILKATLLRAAWAFIVSRHLHQLLLSRSVPELIGLCDE